MSSRLVEVPSVHIYLLSKLVPASPTVWQSQLKMLEAERRHRVAYYNPFRDAAIKHCMANGGSHAQLVRDVEINASRISAPKGADPVRSNLEAFKTFVDVFYPRIGRFGKRLTARHANTGVPLGPLLLNGNAHFSAIDLKDNKRFVHLHASTRTEKELRAYLELLSIVLFGRYGASPESIWCMDCQKGVEIKWKSSPKLRRECESAANLYSTLVKAGGLQFAGSL